MAQPSKWRWYVYELEDATGVFYVGKGTGDRIKQSKRTGSYAKTIRARACMATIVAMFKNEQDAFDYERERMGWYPALTNVACYQDLESLKAISKSMASTVYRNITYTHPVYGEHRQAFSGMYDKLSERISQCQEVASAKVLVDIQALATAKLLRCSRPLSQAELHRSIISSS